MEDQDHRDAVVTLVAQMSELRQDVKDVRTHQVRQNGIVTDVLKAQHEMAGAVGVLKFLSVILIGMVSAGAAVAGVVLTIVARGV